MNANLYKLDAVREEAEALRETYNLYGERKKQASTMKCASFEICYK